MTRSNPAACFLLCFCLSSISLAGDGWVVREDGVGPVRIGMSLARLSAVLHEKFTMPEEKDSQGCFYVNPSDHPHIGFMIENGRLVRIDVDAPGIATKEGVQVGDPESRVVKVYGGKLKVEPHAYTGPESHYLTARSSDGLNGIRFETNEGKVEMYYVGTYDAIHYAEGCE